MTPRLAARVNALLRDLVLLLRRTGATRREPAAARGPRLPRRRRAPEDDRALIAAAVPALRRLATEPDPRSHDRTRLRVDPPSGRGSPTRSGRSRTALGFPALCQIGIAAAYGMFIRYGLGAACRLVAVGVLAVRRRHPTPPTVARREPAAADA